MKTNFCFENLNQFYVFEHLFILNLDDLVYKDFAYTCHERIFEVLIYRIDIGLHSSRPDMILMMARHHQYLFSSDESGISIYFLLNGVRTKIR